MQQMIITIIFTFFITLSYYAYMSKMKKDSQPSMTNVVLVGLLAFTVTFLGQTFLIETAGGGEIQAMIENIDTGDSPPF